MNLDDRLSQARSRYNSLDIPQATVDESADIGQGLAPTSQSEAEQTATPSRNEPSRSEPSRNRRRGVWIATSAAVVALTLFGVIGVLTVRGHTPINDDQVFAGTGHGGGSDVNEISDDMNSVNPPGHRAIFSPDITLLPDGPYRDRDHVEVRVPTGLITDFLHTGVRQCAVLTHGPDGPDEWCSPVHFMDYDDYDSSEEWESRTVTIRQSIFTPLGYQDCNDAGVTCRLVVRDSNDDDLASLPLTFSGQPSAREVTVAVEPGRQPGEILVTPSGLVAHPSWIEHRDRDPGSVAGYDAFLVRVCAFDTPLLPSGLHGEDLWGTQTLHGPLPLFPNCQSYGPFAHMDPDDPDATVAGTFSTWFMGYGGWSDCRVHHCYVVIDRFLIHGMNEATGLLGGQEPIGMAVLNPDWFDHDGERPAIEILTSSSHNPGSTIRIEVSGLPDDHVTNLGVCTVEHPWRCGYINMGQIGNGQHDITIPESTVCPTECYLELDSQGEGMPPLATTPFFPDK